MLFMLFLYCDYAPEQMKGQEEEFTRIITGSRMLPMAS